MENPRIIFIGTPEFGKIILQKLIDNQYEPILVVTAPDKPAGRKQILTPPPVRILANKYNIPVLQPAKILTCELQIANYQPDLIIVAAYGQIIPKKILDIPKHGSINIHPSLLPKYRGASPIQTAILNGEEKTGVTIMLMDEKMDHGPILAQRELETRVLNFEFRNLHDKLAELGADLLIKTIPEYTSGKIKPKEQEHEKATFTKIIEKEDGKIDWAKTSEQIERQIRAFNPWPGTFTFVKKNDKKIRVKILEAEIENDKLIIKKVQPEGKKEMFYDEYLKAYPKIL